MIKNEIVTYPFINIRNKHIVPVHIYPVSSIEYVSLLVDTPWNLGDPLSLPAVLGKRLAVNARWDTGATISAISPEVKDQLNLVPIDSRKIRGKNGMHAADVVLLTLELPNNVTKRNIEAAVCNLSPDVGMILGMDILLLGNFILSNGNGQTLYSFAETR